MSEIRELADAFDGFRNDVLDALRAHDQHIRQLQEEVFPAAPEPEINQDVLHKLRSVLGNLETLQYLVRDKDIDEVSALGREVLNDNVEWLEDFINAHQTELLHGKANVQKRR